jgi:hypothetical protein
MTVEKFVQNFRKTFEKLFKDIKKFLQNFENKPKKEILKILSVDPC